jgi:apolipoprotein N-acyltransferase
MNLKTIVKLTLLFSACFQCVVLLFILAHKVGALSPRGLGVALALWGVGSTLALLFWLGISGRKRAKATAVAPTVPNQ